MCSSEQIPETNRNERMEPVMLNLGDRTPDLAFIDASGAAVRLSDTINGPAILIFLRHLA